MSKDMWSSWGYSVIGPAHVKSGLSNQDAWISRSYSWGNVIAVSDGLGSCSKSAVGSKAACESVLEAAKLYYHCPKAQADDILRLIHSLWLMKIAPFNPDECRATCLFAIMFDTKCLLAQLGDGLIVACGNSEGDSVFLSDSKQDSFSNLTYSLGRKFVSEQWKTCIIESDKCEAIVLCTDGISDDLLPDKETEFARELYLSYCNCSSRQRTREVNGWLMNWPVTGHSDDKTVTCLFRKEKVADI